MVMSDPTDSVERRPAQPQESVILVKLLPVVMLTGAVGMTAFLAITFRNPIVLMLGGMMILSALSFIVSSRVANRGVRLVLSAVLAVAALGMAVVFFVVANHNPAAFFFAAFMLLSTGGALYGGLRDESKR